MVVEVDKGIDQTKNPRTTRATTRVIPRSLAFGRRQKPNPTVMAHSGVTNAHEPSLQPTAPSQTTGTGSNQA